MKEIQVVAEIKNIEEITAFVDAELESMDCSMKSQVQIDVAIDEIASNVCFYAYGDEPGKLIVRLDLDDASRMLSIQFMDFGKPYDPLAKPDPDVTLSVEDRQIGGLGIFMVKKSMDDMIYEYKDGMNVLTLKKQI